MKFFGFKIWIESKFLWQYKTFQKQLFLPNISSKMVFVRHPYDENPKTKIMDLDFSGKEEG
jgi:hypothetical protein